MRVEHPRVRLVVGRHGRPLAAGLAVVAVLAFVAAGGVYVDRPTETVTQRAGEQTVTTTTSSQAVVTGEDALWPRGTVLRDKPVYLVNASPRMNFTAETAVAGADGATVAHEIVLTIRASRGGESFYTENRTLAAETDDGTTVTTTATLDVRELRERVRAVSERIGTAGAVTVDLTVWTDYETRGQYSYEGSTNLTTGLGMDRDAYALGGHPSTDDSHSTMVTREVTQPRDWGLLSGLAVFGLLALLVAGGILAQRPASIDLERARHDLHRRRYEQWISPGIIPMGIDQQFIELTSLEDVVDVAIDTQERVVYDARRELYAVISENVVYYFSPGGSWMETAFPGMSGTGGGEPGDLGDDRTDFGAAGGGGGGPGGFEDAFDESVFESAGGDDEDGVFDASSDPFEGSGTGGDGDAFDGDIGEDGTGRPDADDGEPGS